MQPPILSTHTYIPFGPYLAWMKVDDNFCKRLLTVGKKLKRSHYDQLVGQIQKELLYDLHKCPWIRQEFAIYINTWVDGFRQFKKKSNFGFDHHVTQVWINFQKQLEYNPIHIHTNCHLSFVLILEIPKRLKEEGKKNTTNAADPGTLSFIYGEDKWSVNTQHSFFPEVNTMFIFPADLRHTVMHFNYKGTRTTVAGNVELNI